MRLNGGFPIHKSWLLVEGLPGDSRAREHLGIQPRLSLNSPRIEQGELRESRDPGSNELPDMLEAALQNIDKSICCARTQDAPQLADLYAKQFRATGFKRCAAPENREELLEWIEHLCRDNKFWIIRDNLGPVTLGHYEPCFLEIKTIVTRDGMEGQGYGTRMLRALATAEPLAKVRPVTKSGEALARKCGFTPSDQDKSLWILSDPGAG